MSSQGLKMFSALRKLAGKGADSHENAAAPPGMHSMAPSLQRRFARGVQYNSEFGYLIDKRW